MHYIFEEAFVLVNATWKCENSLEASAIPGAASEQTPVTSVVTTSLALGSQYTGGSAQVAAIW